MTSNPVRVVKRLCIVLLLFLFVSPLSFLPEPSFVPVDAQGVFSDWILEGDTVYVDDTNIFLSARPAYSTGGWVYLTLTSKTYSGLADLYFGVNSTIMTPRKMEILTKLESTIEISDQYFDNTTYFKYNATYEQYTNPNAYNGTIYLWSKIKPGENGSESVLADWVLDWSSDFDRANLASRSIHSFYNDWVLLGGRVDKTEYDYAGMTTWYSKSFVVQTDKTYRARVWLDVSPSKKAVNHKYWIALKPNGETIQEAIALNHFYALDPWFDASWSNRKSHNITGSSAGAQTDYPIQIWVVRASGTDSGDHVFLGTTPQADFGDIRFTDSTGDTLIDQWLEFSNSTHSSWWVEVPTIPASPGNATIFIYYGNAGADEVSDGEAVFTAYENCSDISDWDRTSLRVTSVNDKFQVNSTLVYGDAELTGLTFPTTYAIEYEVNVSAFPISTVTRIGSRQNAGAAWNDENDALLGVQQGTETEFRLRKVENGAAADTQDINLVTDTLYFVRVVRNGSAGELHVFTDLWISETGSLNVAFTPTDVPTRLIIAVRDIANMLLFIDDIRLRKFAAPEPTHGSWGSEEIPTPSAPTLLSPSNGAEILTFTNQTFTWTFNGPSPSFNQTAYRIQIFNTSSNSLWNDSGKVISANENYTIVLPGTGTSMSWRVRNWADNDVAGPFSANFTFDVRALFNVNVTITDIEAGNYVFASTVYLFEAVYQGGNDTFKVAFDDGITFINMSYDRTALSFRLDSGSTKANLLSVTFSETGNIQTVTFRIFLLDTISDVLDRDIHMWVNDTVGEVDGWDEKRTNFLNIYNQGGLTESSTTGGGFLVAGGNIFAMAVQSNVTSDFVRLNVTWRKFQHVSFKVSVFQNTSWDAGNNHFDCISEHSDTVDIEYGVDYAVSGSFIEGWKVKIFVVDGDAGNAGNDRAWVRLNVTWYNRGSSVTSDLIYAFYEGHNADDGNTQFSLWVDLWVDIMEGSSRVGGRVSPVFFGMREEGWGPWANWGPMPNSTTVSLYSDDLLDSSSNVLASSQIGLFNVWASLNKTDGGVATPSCNTHQWSLGDYDIFGWSILGVTQPMIGIDTPTPNLPRTPDIGAPGLFSSITLAISLMTKQIVNAILQGATVTSFAIASIIDSAFAFFGIDNFIGLMTSSLTSLGARFSLAISNVTTIIITVYTFIAASVTWFGTTLSNFVSMWINIGRIMGNIMDGTYGGQGVNWWSLLNFNLWSGNFLPLVITLYWFSTVDQRAKQQGGNWINILWGDTTILLGMTSFFIDMFFTLINFVISSVFNIMNALDIAARRIFGA